MRAQCLGMWLMVLGYIIFQCLLQGREGNKGAGVVLRSLQFSTPPRPRNTFLNFPAQVVRVLETLLIGFVQPYSHTTGG